MSAIIVVVVVSPRTPISFKTNYIKTNLGMLLNDSKVQVNCRIKYQSSWKFYT